MADGKPARAPGARLVPLPRVPPEANGKLLAGGSPPPRAAARHPEGGGGGPAVRSLEACLPNRSPLKPGDRQGFTVSTPQSDWGGAVSKDGAQHAHGGTHYFGEESASAPQQAHRQQPLPLGGAASRDSNQHKQIDAHSFEEDTATNGATTNGPGEPHAPEQQDQLLNNERLGKRPSKVTFQESVGKRGSPATIPGNLIITPLPSNEGSPTDEQLEYFITSTNATRRSQEEFSEQASPQDGSMMRGLSSMFSSPKVAPSRGVVTASCSEPQLCGRMPFVAQRSGNNSAADVAQYLAVDNNLFNIHLLRYYVDNVWALPRPDVIITVTGGAAHFKLPTEHKDKIMRGMMDGTRSLRPWFITGGSNAGIMKYVGEARAKYNPAAPLIGVCALAEMAGLKKLRKICREQRTWEEKEKAWRHSRTLSNQSIRSESSAPGDDEGMEQEGLVWKEQEDWYWHAKDGTWRKGLDAHGPELSYEDVLEMDEEQHLNERKAAIVKQLQSDILHLQDELDDPQMQDRMQDLQEEMRKKKTELERTQKEARKRY